jgi:hypothetical protein
MPYDSIEEMERTMAKSKLAPGKGMHAHLNGDTLAFFIGAFDTLNEAIVEHCDGNGLNDVLDSDAGAGELFAHLRNELDWQYTKDSFGQKLYTETDFDNGTYRVTLVLNKNDELKLDVRNWYEA